MDANLKWTQQLGVAFLLQPAAVLTSTQRLRSLARQAGHLVDTKQQKIIVERDVIRIVPARPEVIHVPVYELTCVYRTLPVGYHYPLSLITFSSGYPGGPWLSYYFNWSQHTVLTVSRPYRTTVWHHSPLWLHPSHTVIHHPGHRVAWSHAPNRVQSAHHNYDRLPPQTLNRPHGYPRDNTPPRPHTTSYPSAQITPFPLSTIDQNIPSSPSPPQSSTRPNRPSLNANQPITPHTTHTFPLPPTPSPTPTTTPPQTYVTPPPASRTAPHPRFHPTPSTRHTPHAPSQAQPTTPLPPPQVTPKPTPPLTSEPTTRPLHPVHPRFNRLPDPAPAPESESPANQSRRPSNRPR